MQSISLQPKHFFATEQEKSLAALPHFTITTVPSAEHPDFDAAYRLLDAEFGARGEVERREVLASWLSRSSSPDEPYYIRYAMIIVRDQSGKIAGVRDCYVTHDASDLSRCVVYLAHVLVLPEHRRSGVASFLRAAPIALAEQRTKELGGVPKDIILAAEMEPISRDDQSSLIRVIAYGRSGFCAIPAERLPYCQPDFRDLEALQVPPRPIPLLAVVRWVGNESRREVPDWIAEAYVRRLYAVFAKSCRAQDLAPAFEHSLQTIGSFGGQAIQLLSLPSSGEDAGGILPLLRENVLLHFPESLGWSQLI